MMIDDIQNALHDEMGDITVDWAKPPKLSALKGDLEEAQQDQQVHVGKINGWLDNLMIRGDAQVTGVKAGRSKVVPRLIRKQAEWRYASLTEPFIAPRDLFKASPVTWDDKQAAIQNQLTLNNQFNHRIDRGEFIDEYVRTAVDQGTVILRTGWVFEDETVEEEQPVFQLVPDPEFGQTLQEVMQLQQQNPNAYEFDVPMELKAAVEASQQAGQPLRPVVTGSEMVKRQRIIKNQPTVEVCDYRNVYVDPTCNGNIDKANFVIYSYESSKADLEKDGRYSNLDKINVDTNNVLGDPDHGASDATRNFNFRDKARKKFVVYEYWGFLDVEGDGVLVPVVISWVGNTFVWVAENPYPDKELPFIVVKYMPVAKSLYGEPDGALLEEHQQIAGAIMRGMIDILGRSANAQTGRRRDALDTTNKRKYDRGEDYEINGNVDPRQAFYMHTYAEIPNSAQFMLQLQNQEAEALTGVKAFSGGLSGDSLGDVATAVRGVLDAASKRELGILRRLAAGLIKVGRKFAAMNGEFLSDTEVVRITNEEFIPVRRDELNGEFDLELTISTAEEDDAKAKELAFMLQTMGNNVDFGVTKKLLVEMFRLRKMPELAEAIEQYEPEPDPVQQKMQELQLAELEAKIQLLQSQAMENQAEAELDQAKAQELQTKADKNDLEFMEQESGVTQERDLEKLGVQARGNMALEELKQNNLREIKRQDREAKTQDTLLSNYLKSTTQNSSK